MIDVKEKLVELQSVVTCPNAICNFCEHFKNKNACEKHKKEVIAENMIAHGVTVQERPRSLEEWCEDYGDALWWKFPIEEPPYVGSPLDEEWPGYHTHWTPIILPHSPSGGQNE